jgi:hypothetical protein
MKPLVVHLLSVTHVAGESLFVGFNNLKLEANRFAAHDEA